jgi:rare lipoprotein A
MSALAGNAARLLAACLPVLVMDGAARAGTCVSASWYHEGNHTASGERFRPDGLTAAHRSLKLGTHVLVTNKRNGRSVEVRINDRGPAAWTRRGIDLSRGAARALDMMGSGVATVCYQGVDGGGRGARHAEAAETGDVANAKARGVMKTAHIKTARLDGDHAGGEHINGETANGKRPHNGAHRHRLRKLAAASARKLDRANAPRRAIRSNAGEQTRPNKDNDA